MCPLWMTGEQTPDANGCFHTSFAPDSEKSTRQTEYWLYSEVMTIELPQDRRRRNTVGKVGFPGILGQRFTLVPGIKSCDEQIVNRQDGDAWNILNGDGNQTTQYGRRGLLMLMSRLVGRFVCQKQTDSPRRHRLRR